MSYCELGEGGWVGGKGLLLHGSRGTELDVGEGEVDVG